MKKIIIVDVPEGESIKVSYTRRDGFMYTEYCLDFEEFILPTDEEICKKSKKILPGTSGITKAFQGTFIIGASWFKSLLQ